MLRFRPYLVSLSVLTVLRAGALAQDAPTAVAKAPPAPPAATLHLAEDIPWRTDGTEFYEQQPRAKAVEVDRGALIDDAIAAAKQQGKLVMWYVHRIQEKKLHGAQMYRAPVLDVYMRQVLFDDPDVAELCTAAFVPVRCMIDQALSDRFDLKPLAFVEPAVVFLDGDGKVVHFVERIRTFHGQWFADLCVRVLEQAGIKPPGDTVDALRAAGRWRDALAMAAKAESKQPADWLAIARLQRLLRQPEQALDSAKKVLDAGAAKAADDNGDGEPDEQPRPARAAAAATAAATADARCEQGLILSMTGHLHDAQPLLEKAWRGRGTRTAEAGYWYALNALKLGDEVGAMRRFALVAQKFPDTRFGRRAKANTTLGPDDRPLGAAFTGFESLAYLPEAAYRGLPKNTEWQGDRLDAAAMAAGGVQFLLDQQRDDGGFTDSRYAYWPSSEITPNVWVAVTAIALTAIHEYREV
nr:hypothetical protein [Caldimonas sp.]